MKKGKKEQQGLAILIKVVQQKKQKTEETANQEPTSIDEEEQKKLKRNERFNVDDSIELKNTPRIPAENEVIRGNTLHLYGTEGITTDDVKEYFNPLPESIEWLTRLSCNAVFTSEEIAKKILEENSTEKENDKTWRLGKSFKKITNLLIRQATEEDKKISSPKYLKKSKKF